MKRRLLLPLLAVGLLAACSGPDAKKAKFLGNGKALYGKGEYVKARLELKNAIQIDPKYAEAHYLLGMVELKQGNLGSAFAELIKATELNPQNLDAQVEVGKLLLMQGERDKARERATLLLKARPLHEEGQLLQAAIHLADKAPEKATTLLTDLLKGGVTRPDLYLLLASAHRATKDDKSAERVLLDGVAANAGSLLLHRTLADLYAEQGRVDDSAGQISRIITLEPANYSYTITLAGLYWNMQRQPQAKELLAKLMVANRTNEECLQDVAGFYLSRGKSAEAEQLLRQGIADNPRSFRLRFALSDLYIGNGQADKGLALLQECLLLEKDQAMPPIIETKNRLATLQLGRGNLAEAGRLADEVLKESARNQDATFIKGQLHLRQGDGAKAVAAFRTLVRDKPSQVQGYLLLAEAHQFNKEPALAREVLQQAQKLAPTSVEVMRGHARFAARQHEFRTAEGYLRAAMAREPRNLELQVELGTLMVAARDFKRAEGVFAGIRQASGGAVLGRVKLSELYVAQGLLDNATAELAQAVRLAPQSDTLFSRLVDLYGRQRKFDAATALCRERLAKNGGDGAARLLLGQLLTARGDLRLAADELQRARQVAAVQPQATLALAQLQMRAGEPGKARPLYEELVAKQPDGLVAVNDLACLLADHGNGSGDLQKALALAQQVSSRTPDNPLVQDTLGWVYYRKGDFAKAVELLDKAAARLSDKGVIRYHAGMASYRVGKADRAREHLQAAVRSREAYSGRQEAAETLKKL